MSLGKDGTLISCQKMVSQHCGKKYASNSPYVTQERGIRSVTSETKMWKLFFLMIGLLREQEVNNHLLSKYSLLWISSDSIQPLSPHLKLIVLCLKQIILFNIQFLKK